MDTMTEVRYRLVVNGNFQGPEQSVRVPEPIDPRVGLFEQKLAQKDTEIARLKTEIAALRWDRRKWWRKLL